MSVNSVCFRLRLHFLIFINTYIDPERKDNWSECDNCWPPEWLHLEESARNWGG